jgi:hypothetical protein
MKRESAGQIASRIGLSEDAIYKHIRKAGLKAVKHKYDSAAFDAHYKGAKDRDNKNDGAPLFLSNGPENPKVTLTKLRCVEKQIKIKESQGKLVSLEDVEIHNVRMLTVLKENLLAIGHSAASECLHSKTAVQVDAVITGRVQEALRQAAKSLRLESEAES